VLLFLFFLSFTVCSLLFFTNNFLLKRNRLLNRNEAVWEQFIQQNQQSYFRTDTTKQNTSVILFIIDALRYDFVDRVEAIRDTLHAQPSQSMLFKFRADPPTTTSQRLRSLLTGSLPVFIEQGQNFNSELIEEQVCLNKEHTVVLGDGTWAELLGENHWMRMRTWPSFNVWDLDGVDNGILRYLHQEVLWNGRKDASHLREELYNTLANETSTVLGEVNSFEDWSLLVAHFLGVDHAGHRYGVHHPEMQRKLDQMSQELRLVMQNMQPGTVLMVFGDHGMNDHGDHGGATHIETDSALFVYTKDDISADKPSTTSPHHTPRDIVSQLDFTPTLAWLLNQPIPFGNLGKVIREVTSLPSIARSAPEASALDAAHTNLMQVFSYLHEYMQHDTHFLPTSTINTLLSRFTHVNTSYYSFPTTNNDSAEPILSEMESILLDVANLCRQQWAQFNLPNMQLGLSFMCIGAICIFVQIVAGHGIVSGRSSWALLLSILVVSAHLVIDNFLPDYRSHTVLTFTLLLSSLLISTIWSPTSLWNFQISIEKTSIFSALCCLFLAASVLSNSFLVYEDRIVFFLFCTLFLLYIFQQMRSEHAMKQTISLASVLIGVCVQYSTIMVRYRSHGTHHISKSSFEDHFQIERACGWMLGSALIFTLYRFLDTANSHVRHSSPLSKTAMCIVGEVVHHLISLLVVVYWNLDSDTSSGLWKLWIPRIVFLTVLVLCTTVWTLWRSCTQTSRNYVLSTTYQSASTVLLLIKGHMYASTFFFMTLQVCLLVTLMRNSQRNGDSNLICVVMWSLMAQQYYFAFGQQNTLDTIQWTAAFVGIHEFQSGLVQIFSALLVVFSVFSMKIIHALCLWWIVPEGKNAFKTHLQYLLLILLPVIFSTLCVHIHRRHLMVWAIFAPKFMFDAMGFCVCGVILFVGHFVLSESRSFAK